MVSQTKETKLSFGNDEMKGRRQKFRNTEEK